MLLRTRDISVGIRAGYLPSTSRVTLQYMTSQVSWSFINIAYLVCMVIEYESYTVVAVKTMLVMVY